MPRNRFRSFTQLFAIAFAVFLFFTSCSKNNDNTANTPTASIMAFNLATDKSTIGFSLSKNTFTTSPMAYANYTGVYIKVNTGDKTLESFDYSVASTTIASAPVSLKTDNFYSVFLVGKGANYKNLVVNDNIDSLSSTSGLAYIRYVNSIVDSVTTPTISIVSNGSTTVVNETAAFPSISNFIGVAPGNVKVDVTNSLGLNVSKTFTVEQKKVYTILLAGLQNSSATPAAINTILNGSLDQ
jgi:hypothetical protein